MIPITVMMMTGNIKLIPEELKDIAKYLGYDIKAYLVHKSMGRPCSRSISYEDICKKIDEIMEEKHKDISTHIDEKFKKGAYELIEKYFKKIPEDERKKLFKYSSSVKSNIMIDVVIDENARETLVNIRNKFDDNEIKSLLSHSDEIKEYIKNINSNKYKSYSFTISSNNTNTSYRNSYSYSRTNGIIDEVYNTIFKILFHSGKFKNVTKNSYYNNIEVITYDYQKFYVKIQ
eukprot:jgi/Orpsp1_1/1187386/evm.model.d7180000057340.1